MDRFGLGAMADQPARLLSGGSNNGWPWPRLGDEPEILFLDEPTSALDPSATRIIEDMVEQFSGEGITIVMTTHNLGQARRLAQDVAFLHRGRLMEHHPAQQFFSRGPRPPKPAPFWRGSDLVATPRSEA